MTAELVPFGTASSSAPPERKFLPSSFPLTRAALENLRKEPDDAAREPFIAEIEKQTKIAISLNQKNGFDTLQTDLIPVSILRQYYKEAFGVLYDYAKTNGRTMTNHAEKLREIHIGTKQACKASKCVTWGTWPYDEKHADGLGGTAHLCPKIDLEKSKEVGDEAAATNNATMEIERIIRCNKSDYRKILGYPPGPVEVESWKYRELCGKIHPDTITRLYQSRMNRQPNLDLRQEMGHAVGMAKEAMQIVSNANVRLQEESERQRPAFELPKEPVPAFVPASEPLKGTSTPRQPKPNVETVELEVEGAIPSYHYSEEPRVFKDYVEYHSEAGKDFFGRPVLAQIKTGAKGISFIIDMGEGGPNHQRLQVLPSNEVGSKITRLDCMHVARVGEVDSIVLGEMERAIKDKNTSNISRIIKVTGVARKPLQKIQPDAKNTPATYYRCEWNKDINEKGRVHWHTWTFLTKYCGPDTAVHMAAECEENFGIPNPKQGLLEVANRLLLPAAQTDSQACSDASTALTILSQKRRKPKPRYENPQNMITPWSGAQIEANDNPMNDEKVIRDLVVLVGKYLSNLNDSPSQQADKRLNNISTNDPLKYSNTSGPPETLSVSAGVSTNQGLAGDHIRPANQDSYDSMYTSARESTNKGPLTNIITSVNGKDSKSDYVGGSDKFQFDGYRSGTVEDVLEDEEVDEMDERAG